MLGALRVLAPRQREVLVLQHWGGLSEAEIAESMGISKGGVKSMTHRALTALRPGDLVRLFQPLLPAAGGTICLDGGVQSAAASTPNSTPGEATTVGGAGSVDANACRSLVATPTIKQAVDTAYEEHVFPNLRHIAPVPGSFYYGQCGDTFYAGTEFMPIKGATYEEQVVLQDDGGTMKYFSAAAPGAWKYLATGALDRNLGCNTVK